MIDVRTASITASLLTGINFQPGATPLLAAQTLHQTLGMAVGNVMCRLTLITLFCFLFAPVHRFLFAFIQL